MTQLGEVLKSILLPDSRAILTHALCCECKVDGKPFPWLSVVSPRGSVCLPHASGLLSPLLFHKL